MHKRARKNISARNRYKKAEKTILEKEQVKKGFWIAGIPTSFQEWKGVVAENKTLEALKYLQQQKVEFCKMGVITNVIPTQHFSEEDMQSIDIKVTFQNGAELLVEVKNSGNRRLENKLRKRNRCLIAIPLETTAKEARKIVQSSVNRFFQEQDDLILKQCP